jgi:hypothetical protein
MTTVVNNPAPAASNGGSGFLIGAILLIVFVLIVWFFGIPALRQAGTGQAPAVTVPTPQVVIPDKIDVTVDTTN